MLAPSNLDLTGAEVELVGALGREHRLKRALSKIRDDFDFVIIDSPPSLGLLTINGLCAADSVLIPVQCEYYALEGLTQLLNTIRLVKDNLNAGLEVEGVLLTMADFRTNLTKEVIQEVRQNFAKVYQTVIPRNIRLTEAPSFGQPIAVYDKDSIGSQKYAELAQEVLGQLLKTAITPGGH
jgi:chromosome partitioning protein